MRPGLSSGRALFVCEARRIANYHSRMMTDLATMLRDRLGLAEPAPVEIRRGDVQEFDGFFRERIEYRGLEGDLIPAFLFRPKGRDTLGGVVVFHQHNGEVHFGKSEVAGEVGDPLAKACDTSNCHSTCHRPDHEGLRSRVRLIVDQWPGVRSGTKVSQ